MNLYGPVRVADKAGSGKASLTLSLDGWKGVSVESTTHAFDVLPPKAGPKSEPIASNLFASLPHPERKANLLTVSFSPDGKRLFAAGYPSGIVQIWDVASRKEVRRIDTPPGIRQSANFALLSPDWKTMYVPGHKRDITPTEVEGKKAYRVDYSGQIRVWDLVTGKEKEPILASKGRGPSIAKLSPDGRILTFVEMASYVTTDRRGKSDTMAVDLSSGKKWKLCEGGVIPSFTPDGKLAVVGQNDYEAQTGVLEVMDVASGKTLASLKSPEKGLLFAPAGLSPDGSLVAVNVVAFGKKGAPFEMRFFDTKTLAERGKFTAKPNPEGYGNGVGQFTSDGKRFVTYDQAGNVSVWSVGEKKTERTVSVSGVEYAQFTVSPDGKFAALGWMQLPKDVRSLGREPDAQDLPQPRVSVIDLTGKAETRTLIAPHGYSGAVAFSPDGKTLSYGGAGTVHLFDLTK